MHGGERVRGQRSPRAGEPRRVDAVVVRGSSGVGLSRRLVVVRVVRGPDASRVVRVLLELYERGLGRRHGCDVPGVAAVLVVGRTVAASQQMVVMTVQRVPTGHGGRRRGVGAASTAARSEGAPEIRVIQRGRLFGLRGRQILSSSKLRTQGRFDGH